MVYRRVINLFSEMQDSCVIYHIYYLHLNNKKSDILYEGTLEV